MKENLKFSILLIIAMIILVGCSKENDNSAVDLKDDFAQSVVEKHFQYQNEKDKDKLLTTLTEHWNTPNVVWRFENLDSIKIIKIEEEKSERVRKSYLNSGRGSINGTTEDNLKVSYLQDGVGPQDSGTHEWWYFVIRKDESSPWLIDDFGV